MPCKTALYQQTTISGLQIYSGSAVAISNSTFRENAGVGLWENSIGATVTLSQNTFSDNPYGGGALVDGAAQAVLTGNSFIHNNSTAAQDDGGGAWLSGNDGYGTVILTGNTFTGNASTSSQGSGGGSGGEVAIEGFDDANITGNNFNGNLATVGGAIYVAMTEGSVSISANTFSNNAAGGDGGAVYV